MRVVLDTNVLISATVTKGVCFRVLKREFVGDFRILLSPNTVQEFRDTLLNHPEKFELSEEEVRKRVEILEYFGTLIDVEREIDEITEDPSDNMFLELATAADADYIVSGDPHLLNLENFQGIKIIKPRKFLESLNPKR